MARLRVDVGTRFAWQSAPCVVRQLLPGGDLVIEHLAIRSAQQDGQQAAGRQEVLTQEALERAWAAGDITFRVPSHGVSDGHGVIHKPLAKPLAPVFAQVPEALRGEAWRRYRLIEPLLALAPPERTRSAIAAHLVQPAPAAGASSPAGGTYPRGASVASVERYLRAYERSGGDIRALVPARRAQGGAGKRRLVDEAEPHIQAVLAECAAAAQYRTVRDVYLLVVGHVRDENARRAGAGLPTLALPSRATVHRRIRDAGSARVLRRRPSALEAPATATVLPGPRPGHVLERVEVDHTMLDLILVDEDDRLPIGRPCDHPVRRRVVLARRRPRVPLPHHARGASCAKTLRQTAQKLGSGAELVQQRQGGPRKRLRSRSNLARPYICRFSALSRVTCPSVWPLLQGSASAAATAARSCSI
jgi:putative transposase